jgi:Lrp/AsnC family transcriptional regulator for asnA, asnC and gidA
MLRITSLSDTDRAIVEQLQADGRRSFAQIARHIGAAERTVRQRVKELTEQGAVQITAVTDPAVLGYGAAALVGIDVDPRRPMSDVALDLAAIASVDYVVVATGRYGIWAEVLAADAQALLRVLEHEVSSVPGVRAFETFPYLRLHYQLARFATARTKAPVDGGVRSRPLSDIDRRIIRALSDDGRVPFQHLAERLGVSEAQVRHRVKQMVENGVVQILALLNPMGLGYRTMAWLAIKVMPGTRLDQVADALAGLPYITYVAISAGRVDIFAEVICVSQEELLQVLDDEVRPLSGIADVEACIYLDLHYKRLSWLRDEPGAGD